MYRRIVEANDSCLFTSIAVALNNSMDNSAEQRQLVASKVLADPTFFTAAVLGKLPQSYA